MGPSEPSNPPRCPPPARLTLSGLNIYTVYLPLVRFPTLIFHYPIMDPCSPFSPLYRATRSGESRICVADDAPTTDTIVPDVYPPPSLPASEITNIWFPHATAVELRACQHCFPNDVYCSRYGL
jgi:hypothetical protein